MRKPRMPWNRKAPRMAVGTDVSNMQKRKKGNVKNKVVALLAATALAGGAVAVNKGIIPNPLSGMNPLKGRHVSNPFKAPKSPVRVQHGDYVVISPNEVRQSAKRAIERVKSADLFGTKERARKFQEIVLQLKLNNLNPQAAPVVRHFKLNPSETRTLQDIASKTFQKKPDLLNKVEFGRITEALNFSGLGNADSTAFVEIVGDQIRLNNNAVKHTRNPKEKARFERRGTALDAVLNHPNGYRLAIKLWKHRSRSF